MGFKIENHIQKTTPWSFVAVMAILMSFVALSIDAMLPALSEIGRDLKVDHPNDVQYIIISIFVGMGMGLIFFGPLSDSYGRKPAIYSGLGIFFIGCLISIFSKTFEVMIFGRLLQGLGGASCRVVTLAMVRDRYEGRAMAKVMSLIMIIFIMVPVFAPSIGQLILLFSDWRSIFILMLILCVVSVVWLKLGVEESLKKERRLAFSLRMIFLGIRETLGNKTSRGYTIASGLIFGSFIGFLSSSQQIFQIQYQLGKLFPIVFGSFALFIGIASFVNSKLVDKMGMVNLCLKALKIIVVSSALFLPFCFFVSGHPQLFILIIYMIITFFCFGILFGNFNALALQPLGHIAGVANSVIGSIQTLLSVFFGGLIGSFYNGSVLPMVTGFFIFSTLSLLIIMRVHKISLHL